MLQFSIFNFQLSNKAEHFLFDTLNFENYLKIVNCKLKNKLTGARSC